MMRFAGKNSFLQVRSARVLILPALLQQAYYDAIEAPDKDLIWFEHSAHGPLREEPETYKRLLREKLLQWI